MAKVGRLKPSIGHVREIISGQNCSFTESFGQINAFTMTKFVGRAIAGQRNGALKLQIRNIRARNGSLKVLLNGSAGAVFIRRDQRRGGHLRRDTIPTAVFTIIGVLLWLGTQWDPTGVSRKVGPLEGVPLEGVTSSRARATHA
jgi:hypothetical protein